MGTQIFDHKPTHEEVLNLILANTCHIRQGEGALDRIFELDLHCITATIHARALGENKVTEALEYDIISVELETT